MAMPRKPELPISRVPSIRSRPVVGTDIGDPFQSSARGGDPPDVLVAPAIGPAVLVRHRCRQQDLDCDFSAESAVARAITSPIPPAPNEERTSYGPIFEPAERVMAQLWPDSSNPSVNTF